ncbi:putative pentatricopeptide repeat-containing protein [Tripterygium wilfordii]|uniref:Putative pentatricopeptide repeat-containing protein n=1 Tax=Tripterygium wilfordii TaxID=458696 RepID=A0A7J7DQW1_TRIWF|nr:putative pentatricopeptide repeat-containing protein [Tripterygium wilfordii]
MARIFLICILITIAIKFAELELLSVWVSLCHHNMQSPSFVGLLFPCHRVSLQLLKKHNTSLNPLILLCRNKSMSAPLSIIDPNEETDDLALGESNERFHEIPRRLLNSERLNSFPPINKVERTVGAKHINSGGKEKLRWYSSMLRDCASTGSLKKGKAIHGHLVKDGVEADSHLWVSLINMYSKCLSPLLARTVLDEMPERDIVSWNAVIAGYVAEGRASDAVSLFCEMKKEDIKPNEFALSTVLKACSLCRNLQFGKQLHADAIKLGLFLDLYVGSCLVDLYAKCDKMELADRVFFSMPELSTVSWNVLFNGYAEMGDIKNILRLFCGITDSELKFNNFILSTVLKGCANSGSFIEGKVLHSLVIKTGLKLDQRLGCSLLDMYSKFGLAYDALTVFKMIKDPDIVTWSAMITCLAQQGHSKEAAKLLRMMRFRGWE